MALTGQNFIGSHRSGNGSKTFQGINPETESKLKPDYVEATSDEVDQAVQKAEEAFNDYRQKSTVNRAEFLEAIADEIMELGDALIKRASEETGLTEGRLTGERGRTFNQLRLFADVVREGSWVDARIDRSDEAPDVRSMKMALGPVAIFGASNFPLAFSVAGGDTASALAAGCPIVVKAHPAHPGTCEMVAGAILKAVEKTGMPEGTFSMVQGISHEVGTALVEHPLIKAVGFTGSFKGGKALYDAATSRPEPIPVYAEMGSTNPIFLLPGALREKGDEVAEGLTNSVNLGVGQFCTNPGLVAYEESDEARAFHQAVADHFKKAGTGTMLTSGIQSAYKEGLETLLQQEGVQLVASGSEDGSPNTGVPHLLKVDSKNFLANDGLEEEVFGPSTLTISAEGKADLIDIAENLQGHLTATLYGTEEDLETYSDLVTVLQRKVGRLIFNGFPTGVEVNHAMIHGGPYPATTDSRTTSVGTSAIDRFARPVCFQDFPESQLPDELKDENPLDIWRLENGEHTK
ncbi:aldehyde dehydrogenase (NADP(+)) [Aliifodinibius salicampi]|uniref:Aldehyde dehydrogenase (NADP(+)) n=1 Tax=Fodinibius salicampi TaxID=1920655 RepID=A0ABT3PYX9_9BACT|nr:aldehyde dehydrogenase (NADP(+)) [Fodinibius salicampi]MCW9713045.1 aldehyde dehydrogenase (NADP(+)) [Fodinibius salicampi]